MGRRMEPVDMDEEKLEEGTGTEAPVLIPSLCPSLSLFVFVFLPLSSSFSFSLCLSFSRRILLIYGIGLGYFQIPSWFAPYSSNLLVRPTKRSWLQF